METPGSSHFTEENRLSDTKNTDHFVIDDLLDFPATTPPDNSAIYAATGCGGEQQFIQTTDFISNELPEPHIDLAELEWLTSFGDESYSSEDLQTVHLIRGRINEAAQAQYYNFQAQTGPTLLSDTLVPRKARSKRSRAAPGSWTSRLLMVSPKRRAPRRSVPGRKCLHCATSKTAQWRIGPMGRNTLCNACGIRYKSGWLVPEYRPSASPSFMRTKHSNWHRKVLELRRQKGVMTDEGAPPPPKC